MQSKYPLIISWSPQDKCFLAYALFNSSIIGHGDTQQEALENMGKAMYNF
jgi:predicted RNase H-like HicB family nuclease